MADLSLLPALLSHCPAQLPLVSWEEKGRETNDTESLARRAISLCQSIVWKEYLCNWRLF